MKTVFDIFKDDVRSIVKHFFVLVIVLALAVLPSLYAWVNIYAGWDPYDKTGNLPIAIASRDSGIRAADGHRINSADDIIADIAENKSAKYIPYTSADEAIEAVRAGDVYAAFVFEDGFTYDMHHFEDAVADEDAKITYYDNIKKNAVASKLTDQIAEDFLADINSDYLSRQLDEYLGDADEALEDIDTEDAVDTVLDQLISTRDALHDFNESISLILAAGNDVTKTLNSSQKHLHKARSQGASDLKSAEERIKEAKQAITKVSESLETKSDKLKTLISETQQLVKDLKNAPDEATKQQLITKATARNDRILTILQDMRSILPETPETTGGKIAAETLDLMITQSETVSRLLTNDPTSLELPAALSSLKDLRANDLKPGLEQMLSDIRNGLDRTKPLLASADIVLDDVDPVLDSAGSTVKGLGSSLAGLQTMLASLETKTDDIIEKVEAADAEDRPSILADMMGNDPEEYSRFLTAPIDVKVEAFYTPVTYGAAMTPFYTIIALWVGSVMLVTLLNSSVNRRKYPQITEAQGFFGRFLIFFLIGQLQAAIVVAGDIFLLHCSPAHPLLMWVSAAVTSLTFVMLIYALTLSFGDIGRAFVVVIMMLQIAGSSGSYPIEILPEVFNKIYKFFPFPYGINAMRETVCGMYGHHFLIYLAQLLVFCLVAMAIGMLLRKPFAGVKDFMFNKMKETEVL